MDIKKINPDLFWQVVDQMYCANVIVGNALFFNPEFPIESKLYFHKVVFRKIELRDYFKIIMARKEEAAKIYWEFYHKLK